MLRRLHAVGELQLAVAAGDRGFGLLAPPLRPVRRVVREQIAAGADWIKVYADYPRGKDKLATPTFSQAELNALVDEARSANRPVAAHATSDEGIRRAVRWDTLRGCMPR